MNDRDLSHLRSMYDFANRIKRRINGVSLQAFLEDEDIQDSVLFAIGHIGECASEVSKETQEKHSNIAWYALIGIRNRVFHSYKDVDMQIVYEAAIEHNPQLIKQLEAINGVA